MGFRILVQPEPGQEFKSPVLDLMDPEFQKYIPVPTTRTQIDFD